VGRRTGGAGTNNQKERWLPEKVPLLLITLLGLILRVWGLDTTIRVLVDEVHYTSAAAAFWHQNIKLLTPMTEISPFPWLYAYGVAGTTEIFGANFFGARLFSALIGTLTIPALYLLAKTLFDRKTALLAALLLATFPPHLHFSRLSMLHVCDALSGTLALAFTARGLKNDRRMDYVLGGAALGLTQYFYEGGRLVFPAVISLWLAGGFLLWEKRPAWRGAVLLLITALLVAAPVYYTIVAGGTSASGRLNTVGVGGDYLKQVLMSAPGDEIFQAQADRFLQAFLLYLSVPDGSIFYAGETPLLLVYLVPLFLMGLVLILWRWRSAAFGVIVFG
ncbi:MAG: glycosyltransferase family 39 protein, partial [Anaerolineae bacterium]|nr:glycosyltransferase family 39 protein [Anaerolineae bacterium]